MRVNVGDMVMKDGWNRWYEVKKVEGGSLFLMADGGTILKYMLFPPTLDKQWIVKPIERSEIDHFEYVEFRIPRIGEWICEPVGTGFYVKLKEVRSVFYYDFSAPVYRLVRAKHQQSMIGFDEWW